MTDSRKPNLNEIEEFFRNEEQKILPKVSFDSKMKSGKLDSIESKDNEVNLNKCRDKVEVSDYQYKLKESTFFPFDNNIEPLFKKKMEEGWNFNIEFKSLSRGLFFEGIAIFMEKGLSMEHKKASGDTLEELFINFFGNEEFNRLKGY